MEQRSGCTDVNTKNSKLDGGICREAIITCQAFVIGSTVDRFLTRSALLGMPRVPAKGLILFKEIKAAAACRENCRLVTAPLPRLDGWPSVQIAAGSAAEAKVRKTIGVLAERKGETDMLETFRMCWVLGASCWAVEATCRGDRANAKASASEEHLAMISRAEMYDSSDQCSIRLVEDARDRSVRH